ncbi:hypothetical protein SAMN04488063_0918 [Halopelagius inordinatus]|uniref:Uncharacterized protein n=1 Tax=Halopelagius inordinatus TaxID=553467 RepID=A0A1I2MVZ3_9EURY|nr:hypothetical protein [Halopelagius inordinatus]SFF95642.1 hypothetical protein SAMN04488063_0918 [Halopelagius inordinatus]
MAETDSEAGRVDSAAWRVGLGTGVGYGLVLVGMFLALFVVPYLLFTAL